MPWSIGCAHTPENCFNLLTRGKMVQSPRIAWINRRPGLELVNNQTGLRRFEEILVVIRRNLFDLLGLCTLFSLSVLDSQNSIPPVAFWWTQHGKHGVSVPLQETLGFHSLVPERLLGCKQLLELLSCFLLLQNKASWGGGLAEFG